jgi:hypothetical protein
MSRITPNKPLNNEQIESALDILASGTITYAQLSRLIAQLTIDADQAGWGVDLDDVAYEVAQGGSAYLASLPAEEEPDSPVTLGSDQLGRTYFPGLSVQLGALTIRR